MLVRISLVVLISLVVIVVSDSVDSNKDVKGSDASFMELVRDTRGVGKKCGARKCPKGVKCDRKPRCDYNYENEQVTSTCLADCLPSFTNMLTEVAKAVDVTDSTDLGTLTDRAPPATEDAKKKLQDGIKALTDCFNKANEIDASASAPDPSAVSTSAAAPPSASASTSLPCPEATTVLPLALGFQSALGLILGYIDAAAEGVKSGTISSTDFKPDTSATN